MGSRLLSLFCINIVIVVIPISSNGKTTNLKTDHETGDAGSYKDLESSIVDFISHERNDGSQIDHSLRTGPNASIYIVKPNGPQSNRKLAFIYERDIWTVEENGTNFKRVTTLGNVASFSWSPDGQQISFIAPDGYPSNIYLLNVDGSNLVQITAGINVYKGVIDWHGSKIAFLRGTDVWPNTRITYVDTSQPNYPIFEISPDIENWGMGIDPTYPPIIRWSPDGRWIVLGHGTAQGLASSDGKVFLSPGIRSPRWKNDSSHIIYPSSGIQFYNPNNLNSGYISQVSNHIAVYSPDDRYIIYCDEYAIRRMNYENSNHITLK